MNAMRQEQFFLFVTVVLAWTTALEMPVQSRSRHVGTRLFSTSPTSPPRKQKKNKYAKFSKVNQASDPLEELLAESARKQQALEQEEAQRRQRRRAPAAPIPTAPPREFPNTAGIDPYDPSTFGYLLLGMVQSAHGVQGQVKLKAADNLDDKTLESSLTTPGMLHLRLPAKRAPRPTVLISGKATTDKQYILELQNVQDRDEAMGLRGADLYIRQEQLPEDDTPEDEYDVADLVGMEVFLVEDADAFVGKVSGVVFCEDISNLPLGHDFLELVLPRTETGMPSFKDELVLIPFVPSLVPAVDGKKRRIQIDPPDGLLDLTYVRSDKTRVKGFLPAAEDQSSS